MTRSRWSLLLSVLVAALVIASCESAPPPPVAPLTSVLEEPAEVLGDLRLLTCRPLPADSASQVIGPAGGVIEVGPHRLVVPAGALDSAVTITAEIRSEPVTRIHFSPDGLQFARPARLSMSYAHCGLLTWLVPRYVVHVGEDLSILDVLPSFPNVLHQRVIGRVEHFSDYAVAW